MRLLEALSPEAKDRYKASLLDVMEQADKLEGEALERAAKVTRELQRAVLGRIEQERDRASINLDGKPRWNATYLPAVVHAVNELATEFSEKYGVEMSELLPRAWDLGNGMMDASAAAFELGITAPRIPLEHVGIASQWTPDLIQGVSEDIREVIGGEVRLAFLTGQPPDELMKRLRAPLASQEGVLGGLQYRVERVARTELASLHDKANTQRMRQFNEQYPQYQMQVDMLVAEVNGWPCEVCSDLAAEGPWSIDEAPSLPEDTHPCCRCRKVAHFPDVPITLNVPTEEERDASVADSENDDSTLQEAGTSDGARKGWDTRGRGRKGDDQSGASDAGGKAYTPQASDFFGTDKLLVQGAGAKEAAEAWGRVGLQKSPMALAASVAAGTGFTTDRVTIDLAQKQDEEGNERTEITMRTQYGDGGQAPSMTVERTYTSGSKTVEHSASGVREDLQRQGLSKLVSRNSVAEYRAAGIDTITLTAGKTAGSAVWAKFGYLPTPEAWEKVRAEVASRADAMHAAGKMSQEEHRDVKAYAGANDPKAVWRLVQTPHSDALLRNNPWEGILDLKNEEQMHRFEQYTTGGTQWKPRTM